MKRRLRAAALSRMEYMMELAVAAYGGDPRLAGRYATLARRMGTRHRVRMPGRLRMLFCRKCKSFIPPGGGARTRLGGGPPRAIRTTCLLCGHVHRRVMAAPAGPRGLRT